MRILLILFFSLIISCREQPGFGPPNELKENRIIGMLPDSPQILIDEKVKLSPIIHLEEENGIPEYQWSVCPLSLGASASYQCINPACESKIGSDEKGRIEDNPLEHLLGCLAKLEQINAADQAEVKDSKKASDKNQKDKSSGEDDGAGEDFVDFIYKLEITGLEQNPNAAIHRQRIFFENAKNINRINPALLKLNIGSANMLIGGPQKEFLFKYVAERNETDGRITKEYLEAKIEIEIDFSKAENEDEQKPSEYSLIFFSNYAKFDRLNMLGEITENKLGVPMDANGKSFKVYIKLIDTRGGLMIYGPYEIKSPDQNEIIELKSEN